MYAFVYVYTQMSLRNLLFLREKTDLYENPQLEAALQLCILYAAAATWRKFLFGLLLLGINQTKM